MFITNDAFLSPFHNAFADGGDTYWSSAELSLQTIWFMIALRLVDRSDKEPFDVGRTLLLSNVDQVAHFLTQDDPDISVSSAYIVTPAHVNASQGWVMDELVKVWNAQEPNSTEQHVTVYETLSGKRYCNSFLETPVNELINQSLRFELPNAHIDRC